MAADAEFVHKDPGFESVVGLKQRRLPYKSKPARKRWAMRALWIMAPSFKG
jgi:hypothetical protein